MWNCAEMGFHIENIFYPGNREKREIVKKLQWKRTFSFSSLTNAAEFLIYFEYVIDQKTVSMNLCNAREFTPSSL